MDVDASATLSFADASDVADWAVPYVAAGANHPNKMVRGYEDNTFKPAQSVTREEAFAMFERALKIYKSLTE